MTTKLKANRFRIPGRAQPLEPPTDPTQQSQGGMGHAPDTGLTPQPAGGPEVAIDMIRKEGLTGRQLRMARRTAQRHGLPATSDFDAVRLLREAGIDPFQRSNMLELSENGKKPGTAVGKIDKVQLPQTVQGGQTLPSTELEDPAARRAAEIKSIQKDIIKRRQKRMALLMVRLAFFVGLPTAVAGYYFYEVATPMYATNSSFLIQQNESQPLAGAAGAGLIGGGSPMATMQDSVAVQGYLTSAAAMKRLDADLGFKAHFSMDIIDPLSRLEATSTDQAAYDVYKKHVKIGYDSMEGIINMEVIAATPEASENYSKALIGYAEEQISDLTLRLREDQMKGARTSFEDAEAARAEALKRLTTLQEELGVIDGAAENTALMSEISTYQAQLNELRLNLEEQLDNLRPNASKVESLRRSIERRETLIAKLRGQMTQTQENGESVAEKAAALRVAEADYETRNLMLQTAMQSLETTRTAADRQARYLAQSIPPVAPDEPTYPRSFENTILAFLIFGGVYLMMSLTASILREQV